jgi:hypothetical protein
MNPKEPCHISGKNGISTEKYIDARLNDLEKARDQAYDAMKIRLEGMNEFREALRSQNQTFLTKAEHDVYVSKVDGDIRSLRESRASLEGKASQSSLNTTTYIALAGLIIAAFGGVMAFFGFVMSVIHLLGVV